MGNFEVDCNEVRKLLASVSVSKSIRVNFVAGAPPQRRSGSQPREL